jgi:uncharacterized membrane protein
MDVEETVRLVAHYVALACDLLTVLVLAWGAGVALVRMIMHLRAMGSPRGIRIIWLRFAATILLALEFALAADIAETAVAPTLEDIGKLASIAAIRTALNYFLGKDINEFREAYSHPNPEAAEGGAKA